LHNVKQQHGKGKVIPVPNLQHGDRAKIYFAFNLAEISNEPSAMECGLLYEDALIYKYTCYAAIVACGSAFPKVQFGISPT
jgi:hypothetical protein